MLDLRVATCCLNDWLTRCSSPPHSAASNKEDVFCCVTRGAATGQSICPLSLLLAQLALAISYECSIVPVACSPAPWLHVCCGCVARAAWSPVVLRGICAVYYHHHHRHLKPNVGCSKIRGGDWPLFSDKSGKPPRGQRPRARRARHFFGVLRRSLIRMHVCRSVLAQCCTNALSQSKRIARWSKVKHPGQKVVKEKVQCRALLFTAGAEECSQTLPQLCTKTNPAHHSLAPGTAGSKRSRSATTDPTSTAARQQRRCSAT